MANPKRYSEKVNRKDEEKKSGMQIPSGSYNMMESLSIIKPLFEPHFKSIHRMGGEIRAKLEISQPEDETEMQADEMADSFMNGDADQSQQILSQQIPEISRSGEGGGMETSNGFDHQLQSTKGQGQKLDEGTKSELEQHTGTDLSGVNIHTNSQAHDMSDSINAKAFAHGQDIYFKGGNYNPQSEEGKSLLAHEVAHTVQQGEGKLHPKIQRFEAPGHEAAERVGLTAAGFSNEEASMVYFGNWMRDMNQVFVPAMTKKLGADTAFALVGYTGYMKFGRQFTAEQFGYYIPAEHIDNPAGQLPGYDYLEVPPTVGFTLGDELPDRFNTTSYKPKPPTSVTPQESNDPVKGKFDNQSIYAVSKTDSVMLYILRTNVHVEKRFELAVEKGRTPEGMMHFGAGLHAVEDLYAHSNFIEIALNILLNEDKTFLPQLTGKDRHVETLAPTTAEGKTALVTGSFTTNDTFVSLGSEVVKMLRSGMGPPKTKIEEKAQDAMILQILATYDKQNQDAQNAAADALEKAGKQAQADEARSGQTSLHDTYQYFLTLQEWLSYAKILIPDSVIKAINDGKAAIRAAVSAAMGETANQVEAQILELQISETTLTQAEKDQKGVIDAKGGKQSKLAKFAHDQFGAPLPTPAENLADAKAHKTLLENTPDYIKAGPSHSQIAKDHGNSIFHGIAFKLASEADRRLGEKMITAWGNKTAYVDPDSALINRPDSELNTDEKERKMLAKKRKEEADKSLAWGKSVVATGHDEGVTFDLAASRKESADSIRSVAASLQTILDAPKKVADALTQLQGNLSKVDKKGNYKLLTDLVAPVIETAKNGAIKLDAAAQDSALGKVISQLKVSAGKVEKAVTLAEREAAFASLKTDQEDFIKWMGSVLSDPKSKYFFATPSLYAACLTILNREMATVAPAYTTEQVTALKTTSPNLKSVDVKLPDISGKAPNLKALLLESRMMLTHPAKDGNTWWKDIIKAYAKQFGPSLAEEIKARNTGYTNMPEK